MRFLIITLFTLILFACNVFFGAIHIEASDVWKSILGNDDISEAIRFIIIESRLPQALTALLSGAALSVSGLLLQTVFRNPLAGPSILGITSGSSLGVAIILLFLATAGAGSLSGLLGSVSITVGALIGGLVVIALLIFLSARIRGNQTVLIAGIMVGYLASSLVTLLSSWSDAHGIEGYVMWGMGYFGGVAWHDMAWFASTLIAALAAALLMSKSLNILLLGEYYARNLGVNTSRLRNEIIIVTGILAAVVTAFCGPIGFIGLAIPHIARMIFRSDDHRVLIPASAIIGGGVALGCNILSVLPSSMVIPINALTPIIGVPVVLYVLLSRGNGA